MSTCCVCALQTAGLVPHVRDPRLVQRAGGPRRLGPRRARRHGRLGRRHDALGGRLHWRGGCARVPPRHALRAADAADRRAARAHRRDAQEQ